MCCWRQRPIVNTSVVDFITRQFATFDENALVSVSNDRVCVLWRMPLADLMTPAPSRVDAATDATDAAAPATSPNDVTQADLDEASTAAIAIGAAGVPGAAAAHVDAPPVVAGGLARPVFTPEEATLYDTAWMAARWTVPDKPNAVQTVCLPSGAPAVFCATASDAIAMYTGIR